MTEVNAANENTGWVEIYQDRMWFGNPRQAAFAVYVDNRKVGKLPLNSSINLPLRSGTHYIRIRQWYYLSPPTPVDVVAGRTIRIKADIPRTPLMRRMGRMLIAPTRCLVLTTVGTSDAETKHSTMPSATVPLPAPANVGLQRRVRQRMGIGGATALVGFLLILAGVSTSPAWIVLGALLLLVSMIVNVKTVILSRQAD
ncbi:MAG: hypothetical protein ABSF33_20495 [Acidimicrobiales bacterium]